MKIGTESVYMDTDSTKLALNAKFGIEQERLNHLITWINEHRQKEHHPRIAKIVKTDGTMAGYVVTMNEEEMLTLTGSLLDYAVLLDDRAEEEPDFHISIIGEI